jgi:hypothetical protein
MSHHPDLERLSKDAGAIEVEKVNTKEFDNGNEHVPPVLTDEEKKLLKRAT